MLTTSQRSQNKYPCEHIIVFFLGKTKRHVHDIDTFHKVDTGHPFYENNSSAKLHGCDV